MRTLRGVLIALFVLSIFGLLSPNARADEWNKKTTVAFCEPVEIPGHVCCQGNMSSTWQLHRRIGPAPKIIFTFEERRAEDRVEELERALKFGKELHFKAPFYWLEGDEEPYCSACWESKYVAIHVTDSWNPVRYNHKQCPAGKHPYVTRPGV